MQQNTFKRITLKLWIQWEFYCQFNFVKETANCSLYCSALCCHKPWITCSNCSIVRQWDQTWLLQIQESRMVAVLPVGFMTHTLKPLRKIKWPRIQRITFEMKLRGISEVRLFKSFLIIFVRALRNIKPQARWTQDKAKCLDKLSLISWPTAQKVLTFLFLSLSLF